MGFDKQTVHTTLDPRHTLFLEWGEDRTASRFLREGVDEAMREEGIDPDDFERQLAIIQERMDIEDLEDLDGYEEFKDLFYDRVKP